MRAITSLLILIPLFAVGCDAANHSGNPNDGGQFGEETVGCLPQSSTPLGWDEVAANGVVAQDLADLVQGQHGATLSWNDGSDTALAIEVSGAANPRWIDYEWEDDGSGIEPAVDCGDTVAIDVAIAVDTDDGQLAEVFDHTLELAELGGVVAYIDLDAVSGSFDAADWTAQSFDEVWADLEVDFDAAGISGSVNGYGETTSGTGPDASVSLEMFEIGTF